MKFYFCLFLSLFIISCTKEKNSPSNQVFPNAIGDQWEYNYNDGYSMGSQHIFVNIVGVGTLPGLLPNATIWTTTLQDASANKFLIDSSWVVVDDQKAVFYSPPCLACTPQFFEKRRYVFPLQVGNRWFTDEIFGDTTKVLNESRLTVPAGTFDNTFQLSKTVGYVTNSYTKDTIWITPNIGITRQLQNEYSLGWIPGNGVWELASYQLR